VGIDTELSVAEPIRIRVGVERLPVGHEGTSSEKIVDPGSGSEEFLLFEGFGLVEVEPDVWVRV
jgi:hypothetical protein